MASIQFSRKKGKAFKQLDATLFSDLDGLKINVGYLTDSKLAERAAMNEYGTENAPARPFLSTSFRKHRKVYLQRAQFIVKKRLQKKAWRNDAERLGHDMARDVKTTIDSGIKPENARSTQLKKGHGLTLRDTFEMRGGVEFQVEARRAPGSPK